MLGNAPPVNVMTCRPGPVLANVLKSMVLAPDVLFAWVSAQRNEPTEPSSSKLVTVNVAGARRSSSVSGRNRTRESRLRIGRCWRAVNHERMIWRTERKWGNMRGSWVSG